jgi:hypothetical protein
VGGTLREAHVHRRVADFLKREAAREIGAAVARHETLGVKSRHIVGRTFPETIRAVA